MNIQKFNISTNSLNFKAIKIANTKNLFLDQRTAIDLYQIRREDTKFLLKLKDKIDFQKLYPSLPAILQQRWQKILNYCIVKAQIPEQTTYIAISENKPCGIMTFFKDSVYELDGICSIPIEKNKKANLVGKTLFYQLFKDAQEEGAKGIKLNAVMDGPFDVIHKYEKLGFKQDPTTAPYRTMYCNKHKIKEQLKELPFEIDYSEINPVKVNLEDFLD